MKKRKQASLGLTLGAIGIVFGGIGASPLYALQAVFHLGQISLTPGNIYGVVAMVIWAMALVVTLKYVLLIMRADNDGEGGIMALLGLLREKLKARAGTLAMMIGFVGLSFFYADSVITPAISILAAVEGINVVAPHLSEIVVPLVIIILVGLFALQSRGSGLLGRLFGPVMVLWFVVSGVAGFSYILQQPDVLMALSPMTAIEFVVTHPALGVIAVSAVVLVLTGAETIYADMGHFGRKAIRRGWFLLVFPALVLNYLGQGALLSLSPEAVSGTYFLLYPEVLRIPMIVMATLATLNASQAVIAGAFSLTRQAVRLGFLPSMLVKHTSTEEAGQVYIGVLNWLMCGVIALLVVTFGSSTSLAAPLALAVSGVWLIDSILFAVVVRVVLKRSWWVTIGLGLVFVTIDVVFVMTSLAKLFSGAWVAILVAVLAFVVLTTWTKGRMIIGRERHRIEGTLDEFVVELRHRHAKLPRVEGSAIYLSHHAGYTPLALLATVEQLHELSATVLIVTVNTLNIPHVPLKDRAKVNALGYADDGISQVTLSFGFNDVPNVPATLEHIRRHGSELDFDPDRTAYFISDSDVVIVRNHRMSRVRKQLFAWMHRNATSSVTYFRLPTNRTIDMSSYIEL